MKKLLLIPVAAISLLSASCGTTGTGTVSEQVSTVIADIQAAAVAVCAFAPSTTTVANILSAIGVPYVGMVGAVSQQICDAMARRSGAAAPVITINGRKIAVTGKYVAAPRRLPTSR